MSHSTLPVLPAVEAALSPFIDSPSEVALVRRHLSSTLSTLIAASNSPTPSLTAQRAVRTLTGTRKAYYSAAVENLRLRKQWAELTSDITLPIDTSQASAPTPTPQTPVHTRSHSRKLSTGVTPLPTDWTQTYDQVLELRRVLSQLTVLGKYQQRITALARQQNKPIHEIFTEYNQRLPPAPPGGPLAPKEPVSGGTGDEESLLPLEKAVVDAKRRLDEEKRLLEEAKDAAKHIDMSTLPDGVKTAGMVAAKEELEVWLDEQLRLAGEGSATPRKEKTVDFIGEGVEGFDLNVEMEGIKRVYEEYVGSREKMLHAFLLASQPVKKEVIPPKAGRERSNTATAGPGLVKGEIPELLGAMGELGYWKEKMDELGELMKAMKEGSNVAARELDGVMGKLRSESQLLEAYGNGGISIQHRMPNEKASPFQGSIELAKMWEAAAEEAERGTKQDVEKDVTSAEGKLGEVEKLLEQLRDLLPEEVQDNRRKRDMTWRGLRGNVGFGDI